MVNLESVVLRMTAHGVPHAIIQEPRVAHADAFALLFFPGGLAEQFDEALPFPIVDMPADHAMHRPDVTIAIASLTTAAAGRTYPSREVDSFLEHRSEERRVGKEW